VLAEPRAFFYAQRDLWEDTPRQYVSVDVGGRYAARVYIGPRPGHALVVGTYENTQVSSYADAPFLEVLAAGWCFDMTGRFVVNDIATDAEGELTTLSVDFEGKCPLAKGGFHGSLRYKRRPLVHVRRRRRPLRRREPVYDVGCVHGGPLRRYRVGDLLDGGSVRARGVQPVDRRLRRDVPGGRYALRGWRRLHRRRRLFHRVLRRGAAALLQRLQRVHERDLYRRRLRLDARRMSAVERSMSGPGVPR
jgi:hypothetical protein